MSFTDALGVDILPTDTVVVTAWGWNVRLCDVRSRSTVRGYGRTRVRVENNDGDVIAVPPHLLSVVNRATGTGWEGNRNRCPAA